MNLSSMKRYVMAIAVASGVLLAPQWACAAGLQGITVYSVLGQPLRAEIQVSAAKDERIGMTAYLASRAAFSQAGLRYSSTLQQLRFELENRASGPVIKVTSVGPINDPFVQFLLELSWPAGRVSREYTFLIDPPPDVRASPAVTVRTAPQPAKEAEATDDAPVAAPTAAPQPATQTPALPAAGEYVVKPGETLYRVARAHRYPGVTQEQMQLAIYLRNPGAFDGAITRLRAGAVLQIPPVEEVRTIPVSPRRTRAGDSGTSVRPRTEPLARADDGPKKKPVVSASEVRKREQELKKYQAQADQLEKNVEELQRQLEQKNQNMAEMQEQVKAAQQAKAAEQAPATDTAPPPVTTEAPPVVAPPAPPPVIEAPPIPGAPPIPDDAPAPDVPVVPEQPPEAPPVIDIDEPAMQDPPPVPPELPATPPATPSSPPPELDAPDAADGGMGLLVWIGGGVVLLLVVLGGVFFLRRRKPSGNTTVAVSAFDKPLPEEGLSTLGPNSVFQETRGQTVDTENPAAPLTHSGFTQGHGIDTGDEVDPVEEADVYIAYGRDEQALEILLDALQKNPHRTAIHAKLLEIYANRKSIQQFDTLASELYAQTGGQGVDWERAVALGRVLEPGNPLYGGGADASSAKPASLDFSLAPADAEADMEAETPSRPLEDDAAGFASVTDPVGIVFSPTQSAPSLPEAEDDPLLSLLQEESVTGADADMELMRQETGAIPTSAPAPTPTPAAMKEPAETPLPTLPAREPVDEQTATTVVDAPTDMDLDVGQEEAPDVPTLPPDAPVFAPAADAGQKSLVDFDLDVPSEVSARQREKEMGESDVMAATAFMTVEPDDDMEFNVELTESTILGAAGGSGFDLSGLDLELGRQEQQAAAEKPAPAPTPVPAPTPAPTPAPAPIAPAPVEAEEDGDVVDARRDEVNTKLDLAKAYEEMGDLEGARELLNEVVSEGAPDQVAAAREMLKNIQ
ncbi:MAG: hypothetical protein LBC37_04950 [Zoogloeaceae bacterium]|jgi:pilus assembly protein FimV|nr:hypothetical protein [Zoogloeaceae bacterium]